MTEIAKEMQMPRTTVVGICQKADDTIKECEDGQKSGAKLMKAIMLIQTQGWWCEKLLQRRAPLPSYDFL